MRGRETYKMADSLDYRGRKRGEERERERERERGWERCEGRRGMRYERESAEGIEKRGESEEHIKRGEKSRGKGVTEDGK